ncbi:Zinc finger C2H2-type [Trinorchestia longiramus]|nr:Zinc finger C2H2-type [Trinorchestia longiramus]
MKIMNDDPSLQNVRFFFPGVVRTPSSQNIFMQIVVNLLVQSVPPWQVVCFLSSGTTTGQLFFMSSPIFVQKNLTVMSPWPVMGDFTPYISEVNVVQEKLAGLIKAAECLKIKGLAVPDEDPMESKDNSSVDRERHKRSQRGEDSPRAKRRRRENSSDISEEILSPVRSRPSARNREYHSSQNAKSAPVAPSEENEDGSRENHGLTDASEEAENSSINANRRTDSHNKTKLSSQLKSKREPEQVNLDEEEGDEQEVKAEPQEEGEEEEMVGEEAGDGMEELDSKASLHEQLGLDVQDAADEGFSNAGVMEGQLDGSTGAGASGYHENSFLWEGDGSLSAFPAEGFSGDSSQSRQMVSPDRHDHDQSSLWFTGGRMEDHSDATFLPPSAFLGSQKSSPHAGTGMEPRKGVVSKGAESATAEVASNFSSRVRRYRCYNQPSCGHFFNSPSELKRHMLIHTGERPRTYSAEIHRRMSKVCGDNFMSEGSVREWCRKYKEERTDVLEEGRLEHKSVVTVVRSLDGLRSSDFAYRGASHLDAGTKNSTSPGAPRLSFFSSENGCPSASKTGGSLSNDSTTAESRHCKTGGISFDAVKFLARSVEGIGNVTRPPSGDLVRSEVCAALPAAAPYTLYSAPASHLNFGDALHDNSMTKQSPPAATSPASNSARAVQRPQEVLSNSTYSRPQMTVASSTTCGSSVDAGVVLSSSVQNPRSTLLPVNLAKMGGRPVKLQLEDWSSLAERSPSGGGRCLVCGLQFPAQSHLERHMLTHTSLRPFSCPYCPHSSARKDNLKSHMWTKHQKR